MRTGSPVFWMRIPGFSLRLMLKLLLSFVICQLHASHSHLYSVLNVRCIFRCVFEDFFYHLNERFCFKNCLRFSFTFYFLFIFWPNLDTWNSFNITMCSFAILITIFFILLSVGTARQLVCLLECQLYTLLQLQFRWGLGESRNCLCSIHYVNLPGFSPFFEPDLFSLITQY